MKLRGAPHFEGIFWGERLSVGIFFNGTANIWKGTLAKISIYIQMNFFLFPLISRNMRYIRYDRYRNVYEQTDRHYTDDTWDGICLCIWQMLRWPILLFIILSFYITWRETTQKTALKNIRYFILNESQDTVPWNPQQGNSKLYHDCNTVLMTLIKIWI